jgi:CRP-like cAMP-binding protein
MSKDNLIQFVQSVLPMSNAKAEQIAEKFKRRKTARNKYLLKEGSVCSESHIIEEGIIRSYIYDLEGNDVTTAFCSKQMFASDLRLPNLVYHLRRHAGKLSRNPGVSGIWPAEHH